MKKITILFLTLSLTLSLVACENSAKDGGFAPDPIKSVGGVYVDSADDFEDMGIILSTPENATDISYGTIDDEIALVNFTLDGFNFNLRASKVKKDAELHGIAGEFESEAMAQEADGDNWSSSIFVNKIKDTACLATCTINIDNDSIYLTLDTTSKYNMEDMLSLMSSISNTFVE